MKKKLRLEQKFRSEYSQLWSCIVPSKLGSSHARCTLCECDFTIKSGGKTDIDRHVKTKKHSEFDRLKSQTKPVTSFFAQSTTPTDHSATVAELYFMKFVIEHNLPISVFDHAGDLFRVMFPDSQIAKKFSCGSSKAAAVIRSVSTDISHELTERMLSSPFTIGTDGSNDRGSGQLYPIVVRTFDNSVGYVVSDVLCIKECIGPSTGENIFNTIDKEFEDRKIPWKNCLGFACDNASVMTGVHAGVASFVKRKNEGTYIDGCTSHLLHLAAKKGTDALNVDLEQFLTDIYYYMEKSSKRKKEFKEVQEECGVQLHAVLKYGPTRWLSLLGCISRVIEQWEALKTYFVGEMSNIKKCSSSAKDRLGRITSFFSDSKSKLYCYFLEENLPLFTNANLTFQKGSPQIHKTQRILDDLMTEIIVRFVKPEVVTEAKDLLKIDFDAHKNQKARGEIIVGDKTEKLWKQLKADDLLDKKNEDTLVHDFRGFFASALKYIIQKFPITDIFVQNATVIDPARRVEAKYSMLEYFVERYPCLHSPEMSMLKAEFGKYQVHPKVSEIASNTMNVDRQWNLIGQLKNSDGHLLFPTLTEVMKGLCCLTHSNAEVERVFSLVRKNQTEYRPTLGTETVSSLVVQKVNMLSRGSICYKQNFPPALVRKAKSAYTESLKCYKQ